jgi:hypothetical protein
MFAYNAQPVDFDNNNYKKIEKKKRNKTIKNKKVNAILQQIEPFDNSELNNFNPPPNPISMGVENTIYNDNEQTSDTLEEDEGNKYSINNESSDNESNDNEMDEGINVKNYETLNSYNKSNIENYKNYIPYYTNTSNYNIKNKELIEKLNYMIHLLEENKNIKSESVTEDVILYSFLGVFIIFVLDSFSRATKYIR